MDFNKIMGFVEVAKEKNFSKAAENRFLTQPTLSRQIAALEEEVGFELFVRNKRCVELTAEGKALLVECKKILAQCAQFDEYVQRIKASADHPLRIGYLGLVDQKILIQTVSRFTDRYPAVELSFMRAPFSELETSLLEDKVDIIFIPLICLRERSRFRYQPVIQNSVVCAVSGNHYLAGRREIRLADLESDTLYVTESDYIFMNHSIMKKLAENGFTREKQVVLNDTQIRLAYIAAGRGVSLMSSYYVNSYRPEITGLAVADLDEDERNADSVMAWRKDNKLAALDEVRK